MREAAIREKTRAPSLRRLGEVLRAGAEYLERRGIADARLNCEWLAAQVLACPRLGLHQEASRELNSLELDAMRGGVRRLASGEPVQYVLGEWDFRGHRLRVDRRALVPRPETEGLVQRVLDCAELWRLRRPRVADVGTGSGCIAISLAIERPEGNYHALDVSPEALQLARENATAQGVERAVTFRHAELGAMAGNVLLDAVVANLPYIPSEEIKALPLSVREHEPRLALDGGPDGLEPIRRVARDAAMTLNTGGWLFLEIGDGQARQVANVLRQIGFGRIRCARDLAGRNRFVEAVCVD